MVPPIGTFEALIAKVKKKKKTHRKLGIYLRRLTFFQQILLTIKKTFIYCMVNCGLFKTLYTKITLNLNTCRSKMLQSIAMEINNHVL